MKSSPVPYVERCVWGIRHGNGDVEIFRDEGCSDRVCLIAYYRSDCPSSVCRYINLERKSFRLRWKKLLLA